MQSGGRTITSYDLRAVSADKQDELGAEGRTEDARIFRYAQIGSTQVNAGLCVCSPIPYVSVTKTVPVVTAVTASVNANTVTITAGATAITQDQFVDGFFTVVGGTGKGCAYRIKGNTVGLANGSCTFYLAEPLYQSVDTTSKVVLQVNPWSGLTTQVGAGSSSDNPRVAGVTTTVVPANYYCWVQTNGMGTLTSDLQATVYSGLNLVLSNTGTPVTGCVQTAIGNADADKQNVGVAYSDTPTTGSACVSAYLTIG